MYSYKLLTHDSISLTSFPKGVHMGKLLVSAPEGLLKYLFVITFFTISYLPITKLAFVIVFCASFFCFDFSTH